ncbi:nodulation protein NfeD [Ammoniphilus sp. CFH 90114]|uniref:NfeD family protein n=1 Tax=Ammoniphilus sp. CFH 90114 TaxID=2493665 RepID=UPI00100F5B21|nr:nodulation protein NfeD [Ammoniphilus sp. CFH 90114]RXT14830.1 nodulation protein NfeD [Ammoniphilus sp. CFH 90114]
MVLFKNFRLVMCALTLILGILGAFSSLTSSESGKLVYVIPVKQGVEQGLHKFLVRAFEEAKTNEADAIFLEIDTPGGEVQAAGEIGKLIRNQEVPIYAFIVDEAFSAGTYIALNADKIIMTPGSAMGSAAPIDLAGNMAEEKFVSAWTKKMRSAAEMNGRDPLIAEAMVNPELEIEGVTEAGKILSLAPALAKEVGYADYLAQNLEDAFVQTEFEGPAVIRLEPNMGERVARWVTSPYIIPILLTVGLAGIVIELLVPGFGLPGILGLSAFSLYFFGHYIAGFADWLHIVLFIVGIILLLIEVVVPGFGIFGGLGILSILGGIVMAAYDPMFGSFSLGIAFIVTIVISFIVIKYFGHRGVWNKFILREQQKNEQGYIAPKDWKQFLNKEGVAVTTLRPSGTAEINGEIIDVVSEGGFIEKGKTIKVIRVEGTRVVVRENKTNMS